MRNHVLIALLVALSASGAIAQPVGSDAIDTVLSAPLSRPEQIIVGTLIVTDTEELAEVPLTAAGASSWTATAVTLSLSQQVVITAEKSNDDRLCILPVKRPLPYSASNDTCEEVCDTIAAGTLTCGAAGTVGTTDGVWLDAAQSFTNFYTNDFCFCGESSANTPKYQFRRYVR